LAGSAELPLNAKTTGIVIEALKCNPQLSHPWSWQVLAVGIITVVNNRDVAMGFGLQPGPEISRVYHWLPIGTPT